MSEAASPRLLARDRQELDAIAESIGEGRRIVAFVVCPAELRRAAVEHLSAKSGRKVPGPVEVETPEKTLTLLSDIAEAPAGEVRCIGVNSGHEDAIRALNWHREKVRRGASVLIWMPDVETLRTVRRLAPDAFSYRDMLMAVEGETLQRAFSGDLKHVDVRVARWRYMAAGSRIDKIVAARWLADELRVRGAPGAALGVLNEAFAMISPGEIPSDEEAVAAANLHFQASAALEEDGRKVASWRHAVAGISILGERTSPWARRARLELVHVLGSPLGVDHRAALDALDQIRSHAEEQVGEVALISAATSHAERGDIRASTALLKEVLERARVGPINRASVLHRRCELALRTGQLGELESRLSEAHDIMEPRGVGNEDGLFLKAERAFLTGELVAARRLLEELTRQPRASVALTKGIVRGRLESLAVESGDVAGGLSGLRSLLHEATGSSRDTTLYHASATATECAIAGWDAERLSRTDIDAVDSALRDAQAAAAAISGNDPPWYHALYPVLRGHLLALLPDRLPEAIEMTRAALAVCEGAYTDAAPMIARTLATHLMRAGRFDEALSAIERATPQLVRERFLEELARVRALKVVCLVHRHASSTEIEAVLADLRATFDDMDAPRITADTLLELALLLPADCHHPDPLSLLEEAHDLFADMPIIAKEARCLEAMGDVLSARGDLDAARARHQTARDILERTGLLLRVPLLNRKLAVSNPG